MEKVKEVNFGREKQENKAQSIVATVLLFAAPTVGALIASWLLR